VPVYNIRFASRATKGVTIFNTADGEKVVSVERISEPEDEDGEMPVEVNETSASDGAEGA
jgi:DNA gyrase subunit A